MIDFIRFEMTVPDADVLKDLVEFKSLVSRRTGYVEDVEHGKFRNLDLVLIKKPLIGTHLIVSGSLHIYSNIVFNSKLHNYDDFTFENFIQTIRHLKKELALDFGCAKVVNLEVGVNIRMEQNVTSLLERNLISYTYQMPTSNTSYNHNGKYIMFKKKEYRVKVYDKGRQYNQPDEILRLETKFRTTAIIRRLNINSVDDLLEMNNWEALAAGYRSRIEKLLIVDTVDPACIPNEIERNLVRDWVNPWFWTNSVELKGQKRGRLKVKFQKLLDKHGLLSLKHELMAKVDQKLAHLLGRQETNDKIVHFIYNQKYAVVA